MAWPDSQVQQKYDHDCHSNAEQVDEPAVWTELAHAQLDHGDVAEAIASYLRAGDSSRYVDVIARSQEAACYEELVKYLLMVRKKVKDNKVRP